MAGRKMTGLTVSLFLERRQRTRRKFVIRLVYIQENWNSNENTIHHAKLYFPPKHLIDDDSPSPRVLNSIALNQISLV